MKKRNSLGFDPEAARLHLTRVDPHLRRLIARVGCCTLRPEPTQTLFAALTRAIVYQQLSGRAAATILSRVCMLFAPKRFPTARDILSVPPERLRAVGLSVAKAAALRDLARLTLDGTVPSLARVRRMPDDEIVERLTTVRGIGPWTVEMLMIFRLGRPDVLPVTDLGIRKGFAMTYRLGDRLPTADELTTRAERWRPYRTLASWYLWRAMDQP